MLLRTLSFALVFAYVCNAQTFPVSIMHPQHNLGKAWLGERDTIISIVRGRYIEKTFDNCLTWSRIDAGSHSHDMVPLNSMEYIRLDSNMISNRWYRSTVLKTIDGGITWDTVWTEESGYMGEFVVAYDREHFSFRMVNEDGNGKTLGYKHLFTADGGNSWYESYLPGNVCLIWNYCGPHNIIGNSYVIVSQGSSDEWFHKMVYSCDGGQSFDIGSDTVDHIDGRPFPVDWQIDNVHCTDDGKVVYASAYFWKSVDDLAHTIVTSVDSGRTYSMVQPLGSFSAIPGTFYSFDRDRVISMNDTGFYQTKDGWKTWEWHSMQCKENRVAINNTGRAVIDRSWMTGPDPQPEANVLQTTDFGDTWTSMNWGLRYKVNSIRAWDDMHWIAACNNHAALVTTNGGMTWNDVDFRKMFQLNTTKPDTLRSLVTADGGIGFVDDFRTTDYGVTWTQWNPQPGQSGTWIDYRTLVITRSNTLIAMGVTLGKPFQVTVYRSTDWGLTWSAPGFIALDQAQVDTVISLHSSAAPDGSLVLVVPLQAYFPGDQQYEHNHWLLFLSTDDGMNWRYRNNLKVGRLVGHFFPLIPYDSVNWIIRGPVSTNRSTDAGNKWKLYWIRYICRMNDSCILGHFDRGYSFEDTDFYEYCYTLQMYGFMFHISHLPFETLTSMNDYDFSVECDNGNLWITGQGGLIAHISNDWRMTVGSQSPPSPSKPTLSAWYPNPSSGSAVLNNIDLEARTNLYVAAYDVLGREVAKIFDDGAGPGRQILRWDTGSVRPGVYFIVARTSSRVIATSRVVVK